MRLSDAIRLGAMIGPQAHGKLRTSAGATCAVGAALTASGGLAEILALCDPVTVETALYAMWPILAERVLFRGRWDSVLAHVFWLNDSDLWTRARIADQVEFWERSLEHGEEVSSSDARAPESTAVHPVEIA